jgi:hypothetical protein
MAYLCQNSGFYRIMARQLRYSARTVPSLRQSACIAGPTITEFSTVRQSTTANRRLFLTYSASFYSTSAFAASLSKAPAVSCFGTRNTNFPQTLSAASVGCMSRTSLSGLRQLIRYSSSKTASPTLRVNSRNFFTSVKNMSCTFSGLSLGQC